MNILNLIVGMLLIAISILAIGWYAIHPFKTTIVSVKDSSGEPQVASWAIRFASINLIALGLYFGVIYIWHPHLAPISLN